MRDMVRESADSWIFLETHMILREWNACVQEDHDVPVIGGVSMQQYFL